MPAAKRGKQSTPRRKASAEQAVVHEKAENVFLFVPNLIGYARVILASISLYFMRDNPRVCTVLYGVSCLLDVFEGMLARRLDQSTKFGAVLDMVTDRYVAVLTQVYDVVSAVLPGRRVPPLCAAVHVPGDARL